MNMFVTNFVVLALIEAMELGTIPYNKDAVEMGVEAILHYLDKN
jgi:hypothetical protein